MTDSLPPEATEAANETRRSGGSAAAGYGPDSVEVPNYRVLELIGTGGMGEVWAALQERPIRRKVALKVIKLGMDSRQVVARFAYERRALALMSHPNIAAVYDAGTCADGRPYFSMEYVPGEPLITYCDRNRLTIARRLELFLQICDGVQHAHQKGVIHRDLKPSNLLVTLRDREPVPKIVDFGLAKATSPERSEETMHTALGAIVGTIEYMSPEQMELSGLDIDTRSDVYSLGVVLYKLLVGSAPFDRALLRVSHYDELGRVVREREPSKPSTRLSQVRAVSHSIASERGQDAATLVRRIRGDLDWITLKALEHDRTRRYQTANALAVDIRRHLAHEPVVARPPSGIYRTGKFVRRHRMGVAASLLVVLAIVAGSIGTGIGLLRALSAERRATQEAETARQVSNFLVELFSVADPEEAQGETITARELLDEGSRRISRGLEQQPTTRARLMNTMGTVYRHLGLYEESQALLEDALALRRSQLGSDSPELAETLAGLAALDLVEGRYARARTRAARALAIREKALPADSPDVADSLTLLAWVLANLSEHAAAIPLFERALAIHEIAPDGGANRGLAEAHHGLGMSLWRLGEHARAEQALRRALATYESVLAADDSRVGRVLNDLAVLYQTEGKDSEALPLLERALAIKERVYGVHHPEVVTSLNNLAFFHDGRDRPEAAEPLFERALAILEASQRSANETTAMVMANLAWTRYRLGEPALAEQLYERALAIYQETVGPRHRYVAILLEDWARLYADQRQDLRAEELLRQAVTIWRELSGPDHPNLARAQSALAELCRRQGRLEEAVSLHASALAIRESRLGADHPDTVENRRALTELRRRIAAAGPESGVQLR